MSQLDEIDRKLIRLLQQNARLSNKALAEAVGLSQSSCLRRLRLLEDKGVIGGYTAVLSGAGDGGMAVLVNITLERQTDDSMNRFEAAVRTHPEIRECFLMAGGSDYVLRFQVDGPAEFERIHAEVLSTLPGVARIHSSFAIRNVLARKAPTRR
ncbi:MAG: Lrp/AsnC family transcriptional regulator [Paracoccus sp. (in: a-proteobacteria)]|uniref:Lrp/AsnC family transcriptional regulator n=1 Tax=Paracoccus sp. TaxID=267 RepID=UPI0026DFBDCD|nr:Lrp/AsnC family transcriptional regulator [Paracoccus sp. (in: a-proteobacteria)]MDO5621968.1 Lrp/AsnC family transcriptional regulator [Paracoccus sp. (in: a-proteobacteria)]